MHDDRHRLYEREREAIDTEYTSEPIWNLLIAEISYFEYAVQW